MIVYNVTVTVENEIAEKWVKWIKEEHGPEVVATQCFHKFDIYKILDHQEGESQTYAVKYYTDQMSKYEIYIKKYADALRDKGFSEFGNKFIAFRTLMEEV